MGGAIVARHLAPKTSGPEASRRARGGVAPLVAALVLLAMGACLLLVPSVSAVIEQGRVEQAVEESRGSVTVSDDEDPSVGVGDDGGDAFRPKEGDPTYEALVEYSERVREGTGDEVNDPFAFSGDELAAIGLPDGIVGSIDIPAMGITLPIYLGATEANMELGAAVVAGTSMPVGGESSNCVIAAHRGVWHGVQMFRDIELLEVGDTITITTAWDELTYRVCEIRVIEPDDVDALAVQEGRDLVTLFTCHPYAVSSHRYLVYCERVENDEAQASPGAVERVVAAFLPAESTGSPALEVERWLRIGGLALLVVVLVLLVATIVRRVRGRAGR